MTLGMSLWTLKSVSPVRLGAEAVYNISGCWLTCLTGLSSCRNMGLEEGSSTDALVTSSRILNFSWGTNPNKRSISTNTWRSSRVCCCWTGLYSLRVRYLFVELLRFWLQFLGGKPHWWSTGSAESGCWIGSVRRNQTLASTAKEKANKDNGGDGWVCFLPSGRSVWGPQVTLCSRPHAEVVNSEYHLSGGGQERKYTC